MSAATETASREAPTDRDEWFLRAWIDAVVLIGPRMFGCQASIPSAATHWHQLSPRLEVMRKTIPNLSQHDAAFAAAVASFFNATEGKKLLNKADCSFGDLAIILKPRQRVILADLLTHYRGW